MRSPTPAPIVRTDFSTSDPLEAREVMDQVYGARLRVGTSTEAGSWRVSVNQLQAGGVVFTDLDMPVDLFFEIAGRDQFTFTTMLDGVGEYERQRDTDRFGRGDVHLAIDPETRCLCHSQNGHAHTVNLSASLLEEVADDGSDRPRSPVRFLSKTPVAAGDLRWRRVTQVVGGLLADQEAGGARLVAGPATRLVAATALAIFPNTAVTEPTGADRQDANPDTLRRAIAFIELNADADISVTDIARAASVTTRAVQLAFRRHLNTSPMAYLRRIRLHHAHEQLQHSTSDDGVTVTRVAHQWGFSNPSRFAAQYRAAYGELPSDRLKR